ncbi:hypothetical protein ACWF82_15135 [Nocardia sp. NPDC055053]
MIRILFAVLAALVFGTGTAYAAPADMTACTEDMACWRVWMGDATYGPNAPAYMFLPSGPEWDALAPALGYVAN